MSLIAHWAIDSPPLGPDDTSNCRVRRLRNPGAPVYKYEEIVVPADQLAGAVDAMTEVAEALEMLGPGVTKASAPWLASLAERLRAAAGGQ